MYEDVFARIRNEAEKRNLKDSTIDAYCNSVEYFLRTVNKVSIRLEYNSFHVRAFLSRLL